MTDAQPPSFDDFPALDGPSGNIDPTQVAISNNNLSQQQQHQHTSQHITPNSWSANIASHQHHHSQTTNNNLHVAGQHHNKLNYLLANNTQLQQIYQQKSLDQQQQPDQPQHQQQQQEAFQQHQQQVLSNLITDSQDHSSAAKAALVSQYNNQLQQPQTITTTQRPQQSINNNTIITNNNTQQATVAMQSNTSAPQQQQKRPGLPTPISSSERCCTFKISPEERRHRDFEMEQSKILKEIMQKTNTKIELTTTKDGSMNFCIIGKEANTAAAKNLVLNDFQQSVTLTVSVPKSIHGRLLGPKGTRLASIQEETLTKIAIPRKEEDSDVIKIVGLKSNAELAVKSIQKYAREFAGKAVEKVSVERNYLLFITGPFNENLKRWEEMGAKVSTSGGILPSNSDRESGHADEVTFTILGETTAVSQVRDEIQHIYEDKKKKCTTVNIEVKKAQHKYILGPGGQNLRNLFAKTGVSVELPHESESETITLRGERSKLAMALAELYTQAHSETDEYFEAETWMHKYLIGPRKTNFLDFKAMGVDVKSLDDKIKIHGPPTEVETIRDVFENELANIRKTVIRKDIRVEPRIHGYIIGRAGATVDQIREESGAFVLVPKNDEPSEFITLEGTLDAVAIAEEKINAIAKKYEASRKLVIDQQLHGSIIGRGGEKIRSIREKFANIVFTFPEQGSRNNEITILGPADEVEECYKYLDEFHQQLQENNHQVQVPIKKDIVKYLPDAQNAIRRIKLDHKVKVDLFTNTSNEGGNKAAAAKQQQTSVKTETASAEGDQPAAEKKKAKGGKNKKANKETTEQAPAAATASPAAPKTAKSDASGDAAIASGNYAVVIGKKEDVDVAKVKLSKLFEELATTTEVEVKAPFKLRSSLGPKSKLYRQLLDEFQQKVVISFPPANKQQQRETSYNKQGDEVTKTTESTGSVPGATAKKEAKKEKEQQQQQQQDDSNRIDIVKIRGPKNIAKKAEKRFEALVVECQDKVDKNFSVQVTVETAVIDKFLYSDKIKLNRIREQHNVKLNIPDRRDTPKLVCSIVGYEKSVQLAQKEFVNLVKDVEERIEETIEIASQVHPRLIGAQGRAVKKLMEDYKIGVKFARQGDPNPNSVVLSGRQDNVTAAKNHMLKVADQYLASAGNQQQASASGDGGGNKKQQQQQQPSA